MGEGRWETGEGGKRGEGIGDQCCDLLCLHGLVEKEEDLILVVLELLQADPEVLLEGHQVLDTMLRRERQSLTDLSWA